MKIIGYARSEMNPPEYWEDTPECPECFSQDVKVEGDKWVGKMTCHNPECEEVTTWDNTP